MKRHLLAASLLCVMAGAAFAQNSPIRQPGALCPDGSDPEITGTGCVPLTFRNAIDEGLNSSTLPQQPQIVVPNDPLGTANGGGLDVKQFSTFGNRGVTLPTIER